MTGSKILVTDAIDSGALDYLRGRGHEVALALDAKPDDLARLVQGCHGWIVRSGTKVEARHIEAADVLVAIGRAGAGTDNIDTAAATRKGVAVMNTPGGNTMAAVEHTLALLLALVRHVPDGHRSLVVEGQWKRSGLTGVELAGKTLGVCGLGRIGSRVAARCRAFEMRILGYDPYLPADAATRMGVELVADLDAMLPRCDVVTLHLPGGNETKALFDAARFARMKPGARLVNCARGSLVDEAALAAALASGHLAGAAIDVFTREPPTGSPLLGARGLVATPHLGASTVESQREVGVLIARQMAQALEDGVFTDAVNLPVRDWSAFARLRHTLRLADRLGRLAGALAASGPPRARGPARRATLRYLGGPFEELDALDRTATAGLLSAAGGGRVNAVNAALVARERGIAVERVVGDPRGPYPATVELELEAGEDRIVLAGVVLADGAPRLVSLDGRTLEARLEGTILAYAHQDRPGVVGRVGALLGEHAVGVTRFDLGRGRRGEDALAVVQLDTPADPALLARLAQLEDVRWISQATLPTA